MLSLESIKSVAKKNSIRSGNSIEEGEWIIEVKKKLFLYDFVFLLDLDKYLIEVNEWSLFQNLYYDFFFFLDSEEKNIVDIIDR